MNETEARKILNQVIDPEIGIGIIDLGLIYTVQIEGDAVNIVMTLTTPACPYVDSILEQIQTFFELEEMEASVRIVFDPSWNKSMIAEHILIEKGLI